MAKGNEQATWSLNLEGNLRSAADADAEALERLAAGMKESQTRIANLSKAAKNLTGDSEEVTNAQIKLAKSLENEKAKLSQSQLALLKSGTTLEQLAAKKKKGLDVEKKAQDEAKKSADAQKALAESMAKHQASAISLAGGPIARLRDALSSFRELAGGGSTVATLLTVAVAGLAAALAAMSVAAIAAAASLSRWIIQSANAARTANLVREAVTGSATSAKNLGDHLADLSSKLSTPKEKLQELALALAKTRLSGQQQIDTLNLVGQAADAMGDDVGNALKDIATRGQLFGRFQVNPLELIGKGFDFNDLAAQLAKGLGVSIGTAKKALFEGRVKLDDGLKALRRTVEKRFGEINARKALDLNVQLAKMHERLVSLTRDVKLEPLLKGLETLGKDFDESTFTGKALHDIITAIGDSLSTNLGKGAPIAHKAMQGLVIGALTAGIAFLKLRNTLRDTFGAETLGKLDLMSIALHSAAAPGQVLAASLDAINVTLQRGSTIVGRLSDEWNRLTFAGWTAYQTLKGMSWSDLGSAIVDGLVKGLTTSASKLVEAVEQLGEKAKEGFKKTLKIGSPSKVFADLGEELPAGTAGGVKKGTPGVQGAVDAMVAVPSAYAGAGGGGGGGGGLVVNIHLPPGADPASVRELEKQRPAIAAEFANVLRQWNTQHGAGAGVRRG